MPLTITKMTRLFQFHGIRLPDPNPNMPADEVKALYHMKPRNQSLLVCSRQLAYSLRGDTP